MMSDTYGPTSGMPFTRFDPITRSWRTCKDTSLWDLPMSSPTLPKSGSMRNGELTELPILEPHTVENECSSLPTPTARDYKDTMVEVAKHRPEDTDTLNRAIAHLLPTPLTTDYNTPASEWTPDRDQMQLRDIAALLPTPITQMENRKTPEFGVSLLDTLIGESTSPQSDAGSDLLDQPQLPHINDPVETA